MLIIFCTVYNRIQTEVNESYNNATFIKQRNLSSQDPYYNTVTSDEAAGVYDVIDDNKPEPRALQIANPSDGTGSQ